MRRGESSAASDVYKGRALELGDDHDLAIASVIAPRGMKDGDEEDAGDDADGGSESGDEDAAAGDAGEGNED